MAPIVAEQASVPAAAMNVVSLVIVSLQSTLRGGASEPLHADVPQTSVNQQAPPTLPLAATDQVDDAGEVGAAFAPGVVEAEHLRGGGAQGRGGTGRAGGLLGELEVLE